MENFLEFGAKKVKPTVRMLYDMKDVIYDREWLAGIDNFELYYMYRDLSLSRKDALTIKENGLRYDITVIPPCMLGREYIKTAGHYHPRVPGASITFPEIYEVLSGEAHYVMQKLENGILRDVILVKAKQGDKVVIPPDYGHLTVNASKKTLKMANWVADDFDSIYSPIKEKGGGAYFFLEEGIVKNPGYDNIPELRILPPSNLNSIGLSRNKEMYGLVKDIEKLDFLKKPQDNEWFFEMIL